MCLLGTLGVDSIDFRDRCQKRWQGREAIHHGLVVALNEEGNRTDRCDQTLQASALESEDTHDG